MVQEHYVLFVKVVGFAGIYDGTRYLVLFADEKFDLICDKIRYLMGVKSGITYAFSHNNAKNKVDSCDSLPLEKTVDFQNIMIHINPIWHKDQNPYYYDIIIYNIIKYYNIILQYNII